MAGGAYLRVNPCLELRCDERREEATNRAGGWALLRAERQRGEAGEQGDQHEEALLEL